MAYILDQEQGLDFDDVLLVPRVSNLSSRAEVTTEVVTPYFTLKIPIISSPMVGVSTPALARRLDSLGGLGILPRFGSIEHRALSIYLLRGCENFGVAVGLRPDGRKDELNLISLALDKGAKLVCIDTANGYTKLIRDFAVEIRKTFGEHFGLMAGNVVTADGVESLYDSGVNFIRVGIGSGSICITRNITGVGLPQLTAIENCSLMDGYIVADGGIRNPGDATKALAFGADFVMLGVLSRSIEAGEEKTIYGMASEKNHINNGLTIKSIEGIELPIPDKRPLGEIVDRFMWGIRSACTYLGCRNIQELRTVQAMRVSHNAIKPWKEEWL